MTKNKLTTLLLTAFVATSGFAQQWIDVTDAYVINPRFDNNDVITGWEGTTFSANNPKENAEHYEKKYNTYQSITGLSAGKYRVSLDAFYRIGIPDRDYFLYSSGEDYSWRQYARLYAQTSNGEESVSLVPASSAALSTPLGGGTSEVSNLWTGETFYLPNNMEAAYYWFKAGYYDNSIECEVGNDGKLTIGICKEETIEGDWTCLDNWKLEYWSTLIGVTSIQLSETSVNMYPTEKHDLTATVLPHNATYRNVTWLSTNERVAIVDSKGQITAVGSGSCNIIATSVANPSITARCNVTVSNDMVSTGGSTWIDVTDAFIINPRFDNNDVRTGWEGTTFSANTPKENAEHYEKTYNTYQTITGLQTGKYRVSLDAFYRMGSSSADYEWYNSGDYSAYQLAQLYAKTSKGENITLIAPASSAALSEPLSSGVSEIIDPWTGEILYTPNNMLSAFYWFEAGYYDNLVECEVGADGVLTIGIRKEGIMWQDWTCLDNWKLEYWGELVGVTSIQLSETSIEMVPSEKYDLVATTLPQNATYRNVTWSSTDEAIATVDSKGQVTAMGIGTCEIIATSVYDLSITARCTVTVCNNILPSADNIIINEIMAANVDVYLDPSKNYGSWVELYNPTAQNIPLGGLYVTDDPTNLKKSKLIDSYGVLPAHGFAVLNFDHHEVWTEASYRQIDDKLDCDGGVIIISDGTTILAQQAYPEAISRTSYARVKDGGDEWGITSNPSPGASNETNGGFATEQLKAPVVDKDAQLFTGSLQVCVNIPQGATLRYTEDGTTPTMSNGQTSSTGIFNVYETTCYRFRLFQDGYLPSTVITRTYIYNEGNYPFPIISVVTDRDNIYSSDRGVFATGPNGRPGNGRGDNCNWNMDWDRPVSFEYITIDNECIISQECDFSPCGGWSRAYTPQSFKLKAKKTYDLQNYFPAQLFEEKPFLKNKTLQIRNGGNDTGARIKDASIQQIVARSGLNVDYQSWQPVHVLINGEHYAVLNMREPNNKDYAEANYGIDTDEMDQFEMSPDSGYVQMRGTDESFLRLVELSEKAENEETYEAICQLLDIDEYANYMAVELYTKNWDWPQNNVKGFRDVNDGKFRFVLFDLDGALSSGEPFSTFFGKEMYTFDRLYGYDYSTNTSINGLKHTKQIRFVTLFKNLLKNDTFRKKFIDTYCIVGGSVFQPERVSAIVNEMSNYLSTGGYVYPWNTANNIIGSFNSSYNSTLVNNLRNWSDMKLSSVDRQSVNLSTNVEEAKILVNDIELPYSEFNGYLFAPITLKAEAPAGYRFVGWADESNTTLTTIFRQGSDWKFYDQGSLDSYRWNATTFNESDWSTGTAIIGYDYNNMHPDIVTETAGNLPCYYFRKSFMLDFTPTAADEFILDYIVDDGMVVYVNGVEAGRYNMPSSSISYNTLATTYAHDNPDTGRMSISGSLFKQGNNVIAVEVHNNATNSTDIMWDASLAIMESSNAHYVSTEEEYSLPTDGAHTLTAVFEPVSAEDMIAEGIVPIRINEVSAANSMYVNDYFKKDDWMELYNTTDKDIDIAGMYISDNVKKPEKYQVPSDDVRLNTIIPAHGYKIIWCDKRDIIGADIYTAFKLAAEGGDVLITTDTYADTLHYAAHIGTQTFGRYPDGANTTYVMNKPTINKANQLSSYDTLYIAPIEPDDEPSDIRSYTKEGSITIAYVDGTINVKSEDAAIRTISIHNVSGMKMATNPLMRTGGRFASVSVATLPRGIYVVSATTTDGDECHIKFIIK